MQSFWLIAKLLICNWDILVNFTLISHVQSRSVLYDVISIIWDDPGDVKSMISPHPDDIRNVFFSSYIGKYITCIKNTKFSRLNEYFISHFYRTLRIYKFSNLNTSDETLYCVHLWTLFIFGNVYYRINSHSFDVCWNND